MAGNLSGYRYSDCDIVLYYTSLSFTITPHGRSEGAWDWGRGVCCWDLRDKEREEREWVEWSEGDGREVMRTPWFTRDFEIGGGEAGVYINLHPLCKQSKPGPSLWCELQGHVGWLAVPELIPYRSSRRTSCDIYSGGNLEKAVLVEKGLAVVKVSKMLLLWNPRHWRIFRHRELASYAER